ncbi:MAG: hypothetical protein R3B09_28075 [Nannocystaceae bacterium]
MPKLPHEALVRLVQSAPSMIPALLWPQRPCSASIRLGPAEITDLHLAEYRADLVLLVGDDPERPERALVVEIQGDIDRDKEFTWPVYVAGLRARLRCPTLLVVVTMDRGVERWARQEIDLGEGAATVRPLVIGPDEVPLLAEVEAARAAPELAILSVAAHAASAAGESVVRAALEATRGLDRDRGIFYVDFVFALLKKAAPALLEKLMATSQHEFYSDFARKYFAEGESKGEAKGVAGALITLLEQRGLEVGEADRRRIRECDDLDRLQAWLGRVLTARDLAEVLAE